MVPILSIGTFLPHYTIAYKKLLSATARLVELNIEISLISVYIWVSYINIARILVAIALGSPIYIE